MWPVLPPGLVFNPGEVAISRNQRRPMINHLSPQVVNVRFHAGGHLFFECTQFQIIHLPHGLSDSGRLRSRSAELSAPGRFLTRLVTPGN